MFKGEFETLDQIIDYDLQATSCGMGFIILPVSKIMMTLLNGIYAVVKNYGVGIILLTLLVKLVTLLLGTDEWAVRALSAGVGVAAVWLVHDTGRCLLSPAAGRVAAGSAPADGAGASLSGRNSSST